MSTVHPSRIGLVPDAGPSSRPGQNAGQDRERDLRERLLRAKEQGARRDDERRRSASPESRVGHQEDSYRHRRPSPSYGAYDSGRGPPPGPPPRRDQYQHQHESTGQGWHRAPLPPQGGHHADRPRYNQRLFDIESGVPPPGAWDRGPKESGTSRPHQSTSYGQGGSDFIMMRDRQRKESTLSIWPPSPRSPYRSDSEEEGKRGGRKSKHRRSKSDRHRHSSSRHKSSSSRRERHRYGSEEANDSADDERRRTKRRQNERESDKDVCHRHRHRHSSSRHRHRSSRTEDNESDDENERIGNRSRHRRRTSEPRSVEGDRDRSTAKSQQPAVSAHSVSLQSLGQAPTTDAHEAEDVEIGPQLPLTEEGNAINSHAYGKALLPGEGAAMAAFVQDGKRIPRRGEIGLSSDQIEDYERAGFVMSGSRHRRMNAVRVRKENQVLGAEEQRALLMARRDEKEKKEREIVGQFREMLDTYGPS